MLVFIALRCRSLLLHQQGLVRPKRFVRPIYLYQQRSKDVVQDIVEIG
jgi:hypothetical protein